MESHGLSVSERANYAYVGSTQQGMDLADLTRQKSAAFAGGTIDGKCRIIGFDSMVRKSWHLPQRQRAPCSTLTVAANAAGLGRILITGRPSLDSYYSFR